MRDILTQAVRPPKFTSMGIAQHIERLRADYIARGYVDISRQPFADRLDGFAPDLALASQDETVIVFLRADRYGPTDSKLARMKARLATLDGLRVDVVDLRAPRLSTSDRADDVAAAPRRFAQAQAARAASDLELAAALLGMAMDVALRRLDGAGEKQPYGLTDELDRRLKRLVHSRRISQQEAETARRTLFGWMSACRGFSLTDSMRPSDDSFALAEALLNRAGLVTDPERRAQSA